MNGHTEKPVPAEDQAAREETLSPPPESPADSPDGSSGLAHPLEDEIIVGTKSNGVNHSPLKVTSDVEDEEMVDAEAEATTDSIQSHYPKRKRSSVYNDLSEDRLETGNRGGEEMAAVPKGLKRHGQGSVKGVTLGYWRDSPVPDEADKHAVIGFIDVRDRLRTRIQPTNRAGQVLVNRWPLPPGPGGSWVTFERVAFADHLVGLDHVQVKEYVKIRTAAVGKGESDEERAANDLGAVDVAKRNAALLPVPETGAPPAIAYGTVIPENAHQNGRPEAKRRRVASAMAAATTAAPANTAAANMSSADSVPGTRPTKILLGFWKGSSEILPADRHAVYGILGANDMFRVKVVRETRDGRYVDGNFPVGAGALWIHYDEVEFEPHLVELSRPEIKEYVRLRQRQLDEGEDREEREANLIGAVAEAKQRVIQAASKQPGQPGGLYNLDIEVDSFLDAAGLETKPNMGGASPFSPANDGADSPTPAEKREPRALRRPGGLRHPLPGGAAAAQELHPARQRAADTTLERTNAIARREISRIEAAQNRTDRHAANREALLGNSASGSPNSSGLGGSNREMFQENLGRLNRVWAAQEANRLRGGAEDAKIFNGIKYERKANGPFMGKLVSHGTIISIDGEDYVEYRVLTKPTFF